MKVRIGVNNHNGFADYPTKIKEAFKREGYKVTKITDIPMEQKIFDQMTFYDVSFKIARKGYELIDTRSLTRDTDRIIINLMCSYFDLYV